MSLFYDCNECKEQLYVKENLLRERNQETQQQIVDEQIAEELGLESKATNLGRLASRIFQRIGTSDIPEITASRDTAKYDKKIKENNKIMMEQKLMGDEDKLSRLYKNRTDYENQFDIPMEQKLMSDEDTLSRLTTMNADQDYALREKFDSVLDGVASQAKTLADKKLLKRLKSLIEKQRMADAFEKWSDDAIKGAFADKLKRNLKVLVWNKQLQRRIANKNKDNTLSDTTTEQGTLAGEKMDLRAFNRGRPAKAIEKKYSEMMKIVSKPANERSADEKQQLRNFRGTMNKDADVMLTMQDMIDKLAN